MQAITSQWRVMRALIVRDMIVRFGRDNVGFIWTILEPMILCVGVMFIWSMIKPPYEHGVQLLTFVVTGYMPLTLFRHLTNSSIRVLSASSSVLMHRRITHLDVIISRMFLEFTATTVAFCIMYGSIYMLGLAESIYDFKLVVAGWLLHAWLSAGVGMCIVAGTEASETIERFIAPLQYLTVPLSPIFYMVSWLPYEAQQYALWNPLAHPYELIRGGVFGPNVQPMYYPSVTFYTGLALLAGGLIAIKIVGKRIHEK